MSKSELNLLCDKLGIRMKCQYSTPSAWKAFNYLDWPHGVRAFRVTLIRRWGAMENKKWVEGKRTLTTFFFQGPAHTEPPTPADVLSSLCSDARAGDQTFEEFCGEFGYDTDSRKAWNIHRSCKKMAPRMRRFLGEHFDTVADTEH